MASASYKILEYDNYLRNFEGDINLRMENYRNKKAELLGSDTSLIDFANGHEYFGFHHVKGGWYYREWAPAAEAVFLMGDFNNWNRFDHQLTRLENGVFEIYLEGDKALWNGCNVKTVVIHGDRILERIPLYAHRVVQDPETMTWAAQIEDEKPYKWKDSKFVPAEVPYIYECHIGMAQEKAGIGTYKEFREKILPRIKADGYNTIQIMAIMEHPYYGSFGYQVTNFFAASSRFGTGKDLKDLINAAHTMGITVLIDIVHSHAAKNTNEGINEFDGTDYQFFHAGEKGNHRQWDTKLFNYGKNEVLHFLLSNLKYWMNEYHFDGFRFDGVTSMIYHDHALGTNFDNYEKYFSMNTDTEAVTYLQLANELIHSLNPKAITIAEDMSGMPGMCIPIEEGGIGFDYRLGMGVPDMWIRILKNLSDDEWDIWGIWHELTSRRPKEKNIGYCESHDQALVGHKTIIFWLCDQEMYWSMSKEIQNLTIDRGIALHKMIRLVTMSLAGEGYLNFMGNEFGHPEWIDFPREGNGWSYHYCRRQWNLVDDPNLKYEWLGEFDKAMLKVGQDHDLLRGDTHNLWMQPKDKVMMYERGDLSFAFNFHPTRSFGGYVMPLSRPGVYRVVLSTDEERFGGQNRISEETLYTTETQFDGSNNIMIYLPSRTAVVLERIGDVPEDQSADESKISVKSKLTVSKRTKKKAEEETPASEASVKKTAAKKTSAKKTAATKAAAKETEATKTAAKKTEATKTAAKKTAAKTGAEESKAEEAVKAEKKTAARKTAATKKTEETEVTAAKVTAAKTTATKKTAVKTTAAKATATKTAKTSTAKKASSSKKTSATE